MRQSKLKWLIRAGCVSIFVGTGVAMAADEHVVARAALFKTDGTSAGTVTFVDAPNGVLVSAELENIPVGEHGFHIHEVGKCEGDFGSAGGHFAPNGHEHGFANVRGYHAGDMPNIFVSSSGTAEADFFVDQVKLAKGEPSSIDDEDGSAVIVHADRDSYLADAGAGARIACGVISFSE